MSWACRLVVVSLLLTGSDALTQTTIRLRGVPERLVYPRPDGANEILTATIDGGPVDAVWLATFRDAPLDRRVPLQRADRGDYEINLASTAVEELLRRRRRGEFRVFAQEVGGPIVSSPSVRFTFSGLFGASPTWFVATRTGQVSGLGGSRRGVWITPIEATRIDWFFGRDDLAEPVTAKVGEAHWDFSIDPANRSASLDLTTAIRRAWDANGELIVVPEGERELLLRARPSQLHFEGIERDVTILQRKAADLPGSRGYYQIHIDDITAGQVLLEIRSVERKRLVERRSVKPGDRISFTVGATEYLLQVDRLVNHLIGDDHGVFTVSKLAWTERDRIEALLDTLAASDLVFLRGDGEHSGIEAAGHLRRKWKAAESKVKTIEEFIHRIGSKSSISGKPYRVRLPDGRTATAAAWMTEAAAALATKPGERK